MAKVTFYVDRLAFRNKDDATKKYLQSPVWGDIKDKLLLMKQGDIEFLSLFGPDDDNTHMSIIGKPNNYHIAIFIDESEEYMFKTSGSRESKIDIAGEYWPEFQVCHNWNDLASVVKTFFETGKPSQLYDWVHFCDED